jgi:hypothetical protein
LAAVTAYEALIGFAQLSKLHDDTLRNLRAAAIDWDSPGQHDLAAEVRRVEQIFRTENGQWGSCSSRAPHRTPAGGTGTGA